MSDESSAEEYRRTSRTTPTRSAERAGYERTRVHAVLDEALICHVGYLVDGEPVVLPTIHTRDGEVVYLHTSTGSRLAHLARADAAAGGTPVCVTVTLVDALVLARSHFHHSMNYRSVVVRGRACLVTDPLERERAARAVVEHVVAGRAAQSRPPSAKELAATAFLRLPLEEVSLKSRSGPPGDDEEDLALPYWAGLLPVTTRFGPAGPASDLAPGIPVPAGVAAYRRPGASQNGSF